MKSLKCTTIAASVALCIAATKASADVVCNDEGDCWHVKEKHDYKPGFNVHVYGDDWKWSDKDKDSYRWREHDGRGYWKKGVWIEF